MKIDTHWVFTDRNMWKMRKIIKKSLQNYSKMYINGWIKIVQKSAPLVLCKYGKILRTFFDFCNCFSKVFYCFYLHVVRNTWTRLASKAAIGIRWIWYECATHGAMRRCIRLPKKVLFFITALFRYFLCIFLAIYPGLTWINCMAQLHGEKSVFINKYFVMC